MVLLQIWVKNLLTKKEIRKEYLKKRKDLPVWTRQEHSDKILELLSEDQIFKQADTILAYVSTEYEVSTKKLIELCWSLRKNVAVPKVTGVHQMEFYKIESFDELCPGYKGILEPESLCEINPQEALMIIPGTVFDASGQRVGYGGGYYDTYMKEHPEYVRAAVAFSVQIAEKVPVEAHDMKMDYIFTEKGVYRRC